MIIKDCPSYSGYSITDDGHVFTHRKRFGKGRGNGGGVVFSPDYSREMKPYEGHGGYIFVAISTNRGQRSIAVHTLLADAFLSPHYCRGVEDKVRWLALKMEMLDTINTKDKVEENPDNNSFILTRET